MTEKGRRHRRRWVTGWLQRGYRAASPNAPDPIWIGEGAEGEWSKWGEGGEEDGDGAPPGWAPAAGREAARSPVLAAPDLDRGGGGGSETWGIEGSGG